VKTLGTSTDTIELVLPLKPEYVSVARLTASGIANRVGFDIETIEDIKVAISEVCTKIVNIGSKVSDKYSIVFEILPDKLSVRFLCDDKSLKCIFRNTTDELSLSIITALMDETELCTNSDSYLLSMSKSL
jgi:serine/threonine-protein kinase RsbW